MRITEKEFMTRANTIGCKTNAQFSAYRKIMDFEPETAKDRERLDKAIDMLFSDVINMEMGGNPDDGLAGKIAELLGHDSDSTITRVQKQGATDVYIIIDGKRTKCEYKTNGGRIESLYRLKKPETSYIVYELDFTPAPRPLKDGSIVYGERRYVKKLLKVSDFLALLKETNSVKIASHKGGGDAERAVQCNKKSLYLALIGGNFTDYDRNRTYLSANI